MRNLLMFLEANFRMAVFALVFSAIFSAGQWLLSLTGICGSPTWHRFWWGALGIFLLQFIYAVWKVIQFWMRGGR